MSEVPKGFKQTEVGVIPEDWEVKTIEELAIPCGLVRGPFGGALKKEIFIKTGYKVYEQRNAIYNDVEIGNYYIDQPKFLELKRFEISEGDFIISCSGTIGRIFQIPKQHKKGIINQALLKISYNTEIYSDIYFLQYFRWDIFQQRIIDNTQGGAMKNLIGMSDFKKTLIPLPPTKAEQTAIAAALNDADALITTMEKLIAKKKAVKQGAMQELLRPKAGWEVKKLGDLTKVFTKQTGFDYTAYIKPSLVKTKTDDTIPFIQNKDFNNKWINFNTDYYIPKTVAINFPRILLNEKSLLISISGSVGNVGVYNSKELAFIGGAVAILKFKNPNLIDWVWIYLKSQHGQEKLLGSTKSSSHVNLILEDIRKLEIDFPTEKEQTIFAQIFTDIDSEIEALEQKLEKQKQIKQGMMQVLLTGKVRLV